MRALLYISLLLAGCADEPRPFTAADRAALDRDTHLDDLPSGHATKEDAVVRVVSRGGFCSGAVVGDALVVTAGHCVGDAYVDGLFVQAPGYVRVELGKDALPWGRVGARDVLVCDGWDGGYDRDIGFVVLDHRLPSDVPRLRASTGDGDVAVAGAPFVARGFGTAMTTTNIPDLGATWSTHDVERHGSLTWSGSDAFAMEMPSSFGDSGGPVLAKGSNDVVGVTSERRESASGELTIASRLSSCRATLQRARSLASML
jgi:hypothetical protein